MHGIPVLGHQAYPLGNLYYLNFIYFLYFFSNYIFDLLFLLRILSLQFIVFSNSILLALFDKLSLSFYYALSLKLFLTWYYTLLINPNCLLQTQS